MKPENIYELLKSKEYDFLQEDERIKDSIILLTMGGSYAYGTNQEDSDIDIRGVALNSKREILSNNIVFDQIVDQNTDTTIYGILKFFKLLKKSNPNMIEILGCRTEEILYVHPLAQKILDRKDIFLSKQVARTFAGYADTQLNRFLNKNAKYQSKEEQEKRILFSIEKAMKNLSCMTDIDIQGLHMYMNYETLCIDMNLKKYPLRDLNKILHVTRQVYADYDRLGFRNSKAFHADKGPKHLMHLVRLYLMGIEILEKQEIHTYREKNLDLLKEIREGDSFFEEKDVPNQMFFDLVNDLRKRLDKALERSSLPEKIDEEKVDDLLIEIIQQIV